MKKNIIYLSILIALLSVTFYSEEIFKKSVLMTRDLEKKILVIDDRLQEIKFPNFSLKKNKEDWVVDHSILAVKNEKILRFISILKGLSIKDEIINKSLADYTKFKKIPFELSYQGGEVKKFFLGDVVEATGAFYIIENIDETNFKIYLSYDESFFEETYSNQLELDLKKYLRLKYLFNSNGVELLNKKISQFVNSSLVKKVNIKNIRNRAFELDFESGATIPAAPEGIDYKEIKSIFESALNELKIKDIIKDGQHIISNPVAEITIFADTEMHMKLYASLNGKFGRYLKFRDGHEVYELSVNQENLFFLNVQHFWMKKLKINEKISDLDELPFKLKIKSQGDSFFSFKINDFESFEVKAVSNNISKISQTHINLLFNLIFNLADFKEAVYIDWNLQKPRYEGIDLELFGRHFKISQTDQFLVVTDLEKMIEYNYKYNTQIIDADFFDNIFTVTNN